MIATFNWIEVTWRSYEVTSNGFHEVEDNFLVAMRLGETPVHISNTMVKT